MQPEEELNDINFYLGIAPGDSDLTVDISLISKASHVIDQFAENNYSLARISLSSEPDEEGLDLIFLVGDKRVTVEFPIEDAEWNIITIQNALEKWSYYRPRVMVYDLSIDSNIEQVISIIKEESQRTGRESLVINTWETF